MHFISQFTKSYDLLSSASLPPPQSSSPSSKRPAVRPRSAGAQQQAGGDWQRDCSSSHRDEQPAAGPEATATAVSQRRCHNDADYGLNSLDVLMGGCQRPDTGDELRRPRCRRRELDGERHRAVSLERLCTQTKTAAAEGSKPNNGRGYFRRFFQ